MGKIDTQKIWSSISEIESSEKEYKDFNEVVKTITPKKTIDNWKKVLSDYDKSPSIFKILKVKAVQKETAADCRKVKLAVLKSKASIEKTIGLQKSNLDDAEKL